MAIAVVLSLALLLLVRARYQPPVPLPAIAPTLVFSAARADAFLATTLANGQPHPVGSAADAAMREAIIARLQSFGYQPRVEQGFACSYDGVCAQVENVLARLSGSAGGKAVLLASHYDSVPAGPGASDDGSGVAAALEIARILKAGQPPLHPVIFLFDEGEEAGLLGAVAFVEQNPWAREVGAAVNLEARGTTGPSLMFETGGHSLWLMPLFARAVRRPLANSLFYAVYRRLPNDTDFSIFSRHGIDGFNFAFIGGVSRYHTPLDDVKHLDPGSLQSQGEHGLEAVRALANANIGSQSGGEAVFFDVAAWRMIWWPLRWTIWLAALAILLLLACAGRLLRKEGVEFRDIGMGLATWAVGVVLAAVMGFVLGRALRVVGAMPGGWVAHPAALEAAFWLLGLAGAFVAAAWLGRKAGFWELWCGVWLCWGLLALVAAIVLPQASFLWLVPALSAGTCGLAALLMPVSGWRAATAAIVPALVAALLTFELALQLYPALGTSALTIIAAMLASSGAALAPLLLAAPPKLRWRTTVFSVAALVLLAIFAAFLAPYTTDSPDRLNFINVAENLGSPSASDFVFAAPESGRLPSNLRRTGAWESRPVRLLPWSHVMAYRQKQEDKSWALPSEYEPKLEVRQKSLVGNRLAVSAILKAGGVPVTAIAFPPNVRVNSFTMQGQQMPPLSSRALREANGWSQYACVTTPPGGVAVTFAVTGPPKFDVALLSEWGWPQNWNPLPLQRPPNAVRSQSGDIYVLVYSLELGSAVEQAKLAGEVTPAGRPNR